MSQFSFLKFMQTWEFQKIDIPDDHEGKESIAQKLQEYGVSLFEHMESLATDK